MPLQVTVTPGITVDENTVLTPDVMKRIATPTVDVRGTVDGQSAISIADKAVGNQQMADMPANTVKGVGAAGRPRDLVLDATLKATDGAAGTGTLKVADGGIGPTQLAPGAIVTGSIADQSVTRGKIETEASLSVIGNPSSIVAPPEQIVLEGFAITDIAIVNSTRRSRASNVTTVITGTAHLLTEGQLVNINDVATTPDATLNAFHVPIHFVDATTFTYPNTGAAITDGAYLTLRIRRIDQAKISAIASAKQSSIAMTNYMNHRDDADYVATPTIIPLWRDDNPIVGDRMKKFLSDATTEFSCSYTPKVVGSRLLVEVSSHVRQNKSDGITTAWLALFQNPTDPTPALVTMNGIIPLDSFGIMRFSHVTDPINASPIVPVVFKLKYASAESMFFNDKRSAPQTNPHIALTPQTIIKVTEIF